MAVSEETLPVHRTLRVPRPGRRFLAFVVAGLLGAGAATAGLVAFHESLAGRILPGVSAAGVDLGGLTPDQARAAIAAQYHELTDGRLVLRSDIGSTTIAFADVRRGAKVDEMVAEASALGRGGTWFDETLAAIRLRMEPRAVPLAFSYDATAVDAAVRAFVDRTTLAPVDASAIRTSAGFETIPAIDGHRIDLGPALAAVKAALDDPATPVGMEVPATLTSVSPKLTTADADRARTGAESMVAKLLLKSGSTTWTVYAGRIRTWIGFGWVDGVYRPVIDRSLIPAAFGTIGKRVARPVHNAAFLRDKHGRIVGAMAESAGRELDVKAATDQIAAAVEGRAAGTPATSVKLPLVAILPKTTTADVVKTAPLMVMVGSWTTHYQVAAHNGFGANITVPTRTLNGTVVQPGAVFDFWQSLGEVSFRTGYRLGGAIVGGHSVEGKALAGGICAASTTLFNAALRGGFEIDARQPHWYYITRYPLGLDATVSGTQTMRFRNDTRYPILIRGFASPGMVRYEIWSVPNGRTVSLSRPHRHERGEGLRHDREDGHDAARDQPPDGMAGGRQGCLGHPNGPRRERPRDPPGDVHLPLPPDGRDQHGRDRLRAFGRRGVRRALR